MKELTLEITNNCFLNCIQCSTKANPKGKIYFSLEQVASYLDRFTDFDVVRLSGGEPFQHPQLRDIVRIIHKQNKKVQILSCGVKNGREISEKEMSSVKKYIDEIIFSMHGDDPLHDQIVTSDEFWLRHPPYWDMVSDSADNALMNGINVSFQTVLMQANYSQLESIAHCLDSLSYCRKVNCSIDKNTKWHILRFVKQGRGEENSAQALNPEQLKDLPNVLKELSERYKVSITYSNSFAQDQCDCGSQKAVVTVDQEIIPCSALKYNPKNKGKFGCKYRI